MPSSAHHHGFSGGIFCHIIVFPVASLSFCLELCASLFCQRNFSVLSHYILSPIHFEIYSGSFFLYVFYKFLMYHIFMSVSFLCTYFYLLFFFSFSTKMAQVIIPWSNYYRPLKATFSISIYCSSGKYLERTQSPYLQTPSSSFSICSLVYPLILSSTSSQSQIYRSLLFLSHIFTLWHIH